MSHKIDAHHHCWRVARGDYHWMPDSGPLRYDYLPTDLAPLNRAAGVDGTILVQAAQTVAETDFLLDLAEQPDSFILGVTGWVDMDAASAADDLERLAQHPKLVAIRPMLQDLPEVDWVIRPQVIANLKRLPGLGLRFEVLSFPEHLPYALQAIDHVPDLPVVINHLSKPRYREGVNPEWRRWMGEFAQRPHVCCKLSGMVTEVGEDWRVDDLRAHADFVLEAFGPQRVMFGSDWPVCLKVASHARVVEVAEKLTAHLSPPDHAAVWGETAARFYGV